MKRVIIDTDPGVDDALALFLALKSPELRVEAITTVAGNALVEDCTRNVFTILGLLKPEHPPVVARGAARPLHGELRTAPEVHGSDGLGGVSLLRNPDGSFRYPEPHITLAPVQAPDLILELTDRYPGEITLTTLGPLTNVAQALLRDRERMMRLREVISMGGAILVPGNTSAVAEFNISVDPEAAQIVFASDLPLTLIPLDVTERVRLSGEALRTWLEPLADPPAQFLLDATAALIEFSEKWEGFAGVILHDPLTVGVAIDRSLVKTRPMWVQVETKGEMTKGMTVADRRPHRTHGKPNLHVALEVDAERFLSLLIERLCRRL